MFTFREAETALLGRPEAGKRPYSSSWTRSRRWAIPPLADRFRVKARIPVAVGPYGPPGSVDATHTPGLEPTGDQPTQNSDNQPSGRPAPCANALLAYASSAINRHSQSGDLRYIVPRKRHIVLIEHLQSAHYIILRKTVDILHAHIVIGFQQEKASWRSSSSLIPHFIA